MGKPDNRFSEPIEVQWAELRGATKGVWVQLPRKRQEEILKLTFVKRWHGAQLFFDAPYPESFVAPPLARYLEVLTGSADFACFSSAALTARRSAERLEALIREPKRFAAITFGADVAERDSALLTYFITTKAYTKALRGEASVVIGPKGSGKTAIIRALQDKMGAHNTILITPEVFATSMLRQVLEDGRGLWDEDQAFVSTWIFTILVEVFKRLAADPRGVPSAALRKLRVFLRDNAKYQDLDLFTRFIGYLKRIEGVKIGTHELTVKTRMLQELYSLAPLYEIVPGLRGSGQDMFILLDELDTGWDNTQHANLFVASLLKAAIKIQSLGLSTRVIAFLRSEIFDLIKDKLDQLDKLRSGIQVIRWSSGELANLIVTRVARSLSFEEPRTGHESAIANALFEGTILGLSGFEYLLSRTSFRPREVLQFAKQAHSISVEAGLTTIGTESLLKAEEDFSSWKFEHLCSEYTHIYPGLKDLIWTFRASGPVMSESDALAVTARYISQVGELRPPWARGAGPEILQLLYNIEFIGVPRPLSAAQRIGVVGQYEFAYERRAATVRSATSFLIHPAFWSVLEVPQA